MTKLSFFIWAAWLLLVIISFAILEGEALTSRRWDTFSHWNWVVTSKFPLWPVFYGLLFGGLAVHFFWTNQGLAAAYRAMKTAVGLGPGP